MKRLYLLNFLLILILISAVNPCISASNIITPTKKEVRGGGSLTDSNILYVGRWDKSNPDYYHGHWSGAYMRVDFTGNSIGINLASKDSIWLIVQIDNEVPRKILASSGKTLNEYPLAEGRHTIIVGAGVANVEILFKGFRLDEGAVTYPPRKKRLIEYIGDSITEGGGPAGMYSYNYAWCVSDRLDCDHTRIANSALALCSGYSIPEVNRIGMDSLYFNMKNFKHYVYNDNTVFTPWDFNEYTPDLVFIFLGTNDSDGKVWTYNASDVIFKERLDKFLIKIRDKFPHAHIAVMNPFTGVFKDVIAEQIQQMREKGDEKAHFINSTGWLTNPDDFTDGIHLNDQGTTKLVNRLYDILNPIIQSIK